MHILTYLQFFISVVIIINLFLNKYYLIIEYKLINLWIIK